MGQITKVKTWVDQENVHYTDINANYDTIYNEFNGNIDNDNIKASANIAVTKIAGTAVNLSSAQTLTNKIIDGHANTITNVGVPESGWQPAGETWVYASADDPTYTFVIEDTDLTGKYSPGMKIRLDQTTTKYFIITKVDYATDTTITVFGGSDYDLANAAITNPYYSTQRAPFGFPTNPEKWTVSTSSSTTVSQNTPSAGTWYNLGSISLDIPIGCWYVDYHALVDSNKSATILDIQATLSTTDNTNSDTDFHTYMQIGGANGSQTPTFSAMRGKHLTLSSKTTYYLNACTSVSSAQTLRFVGAIIPTTIRAVCAYL